MATIDNFTVKVGVEGAATLDQVNAKLASIDESAKKTATAMNQVQGGVRNVAYQIQDLAVQLAGGTNAFVAFGQQLPQLLSGFGLFGVIAGAVAAVGIPLLQIGLKAAGVDFRNLKEMTDDASKSTQAYLDAQKANQTTLAGLGNSYGALTNEAKAFFELRERLTQQKAERDATDAVKELRDEYGKMSREQVEANRRFASMIPGGLIGTELLKNYREFAKGLTEEQGFKVAEMLKGIDAASPEKTVAALNSVLDYLGQLGPQAEKFKQVFEKSIEPIMKVNEEIIKNKTNIKEAAEQASAFNTKLLDIQSNYVGKIGDARRAFNLIGALRLEQEEKIKEIQAQFAEKNKDGVNRTKEQLAAENKVRAEIGDKIKDVQNAQVETTRSATLTNEAKARQLDLEEKIVLLQDMGRHSLSYEVQYQADLAKNAIDYKDALIATAEQRRKGLITGEQQATLDAQAAKNRSQADTNAELNRQKRIADAADAQRAALFELDSKQRAIGYDAETLKIRQNMREAYPEDIDTAVKIAQLKNNELEIERKINEEVALGKISQADATERIGKSREELQAALELERARNREALRYKTGTAAEGAAAAMAKIARENLSSFEKSGKMVESVYGNMMNAVDKFVDSGKFKFKDFAASVIQDLIKIEMKSQVTSIFTSLRSAGGSFFDTIGSFLTGKAEGGPVNSGTPYIVGERGPELFVPSSAGSIVSNKNMLKNGAGGGTTYVNYHINAVDSMSFKQMLAQDPSFLHSVAEVGRRAIPSTRR
jgi:hypothetical protein